MAGHPAATSLPSLRGTIVAALGAAATLGCAAAIGMVSIAGATAPASPGTHQPISTVQSHQPAAHR